MLTPPKSLSKTKFYSLIYKQTKYNSNRSKTVIRTTNLPPNHIVLFLELFKNYYYLRNGTVSEQKLMKARFV